jgi:FkbM family methyltransferase
MLRSTITSLVRHGLAKANRKIVHLDAFGQNALIDAMSLLSNRSTSLNIFDVGANVGSFAKASLDLHPKAVVQAFEPFPAAFQELSALEIAYPGRMRAHNLALSDMTGTQTLYVNAQSVTNSLLTNAPEADAYQPPSYAQPLGQIEVKLDTLDTFCEANSLRQIDLLKTDTQGADLKVLKGGEQMIAAGKVDIILIEVLFVHLYEGQSWFGDIFSWLTQRGYGFVNLYDVAHHADTREAKWADALFVNRSALQQMPIL